MPCDFSSPLDSQAAVNAAIASCADDLILSNTSSFINAVSNPLKIQNYTEEKLSIGLYSFEGPNNYTNFLFLRHGLTITGSNKLKSIAINNQNAYLMLASQDSLLPVPPNKSMGLVLEDLPQLESVDATSILNATNLTLRNLPVLRSFEIGDA